MDPFVSYDDSNIRYTSIRECLNAAIRGKQVESLDKITMVLLSQTGST